MKTCFGLAFPAALAALFLLAFTGMQLPTSALKSDPGFLGVYFTSGDDATIDRCVKGSPAEDAGFKSGDRIIAVNGKPVKAQSDLIKALSSTEAGDTVEIEGRVPKIQ